MSIEAMEIISNAMKELGLPYNFLTFKVKDGEKVPKRYFTGEYEEREPLNEDGMQETQFLLNGFSREWLALEEAKQKIESYFSKVSGKTVTTEAGSAVIVFYLNSLVIPTGDAELKKIQINLLVKEWKV